MSVKEFVAITGLMISSFALGFALGRALKNK